MILTVFVLVSLLQAPARNACTWSAASEIGSLNTVVNESSGMAISRRIPNRSYRINDSGDSGRFFVMDLGGGGVQIVNISGFTPVDTEDMAIGPCGDSTDCIFIGDIGDNTKRRQFYDLVIIEERANFPSEVRPTYRIRLRYPDGPHDAEALGVHPDGSIYITTKDTTKSRIYRLKRDQWRNDSSSERTLDFVVDLDWSKLRPSTFAFTRMVTGMNIAPDGRSFLLLNYGDAMEFFVDLSAAKPDSSNWKEGVDYRTLALTTLEQEEAISYLPDGKSLLYDTESSPSAPRARIMRMDCK